MRKLLKYFLLTVGAIVTVFLIFGASYRLITGKMLTISFASSGYDKHSADQKETLTVNQPFDAVFRDLSAYIRYNDLVTTAYGDKDQPIFREWPSSFSRIAHTLINFKGDEAIESYGKYFHCKKSEPIEAVGGSLFIIGDQNKTEIQFMISLVSTNLSAKEFRKDCSMKKGLIKQIIEEVEIKQ